MVRERIHLALKAKYQRMGDLGNSIPYSVRTFRKGYVMIEVQRQLWCARIMALAKCPPGHAEALLRAVMDRSFVLTIDNRASAHDALWFLLTRTLERLAEGYSIPAVLSALPKTLGDLAGQKLVATVGNTNLLSPDELQAVRNSAITVEARQA